MLTAHASCMAVLPSPVSAKIAARPLRSAHEVNEARNGYSDGGSEHSVRPTPDHSRRLLARNDSYAHEPSHSSRQYDIPARRTVPTHTRTSHRIPRDSTTCRDVADSCPLLGHVVTSAKGASIHP